MTALVTDQHMLRVSRTYIDADDTAVNYSMAREPGQLWERLAGQSPVITDRYLDIWESSEVATKGTVGPASWERVTYVSAVGASGRNWLAPVMVPEASGVIHTN